MIKSLPHISHLLLEFFVFFRMSENNSNCGPVLVDRIEV
jgi:hypothetical protein